MLNEERVKQMTRLAMFEKRERADLRLAEGYRGKDYRHTHMFGAFFLGTFLYLLIFAGVLAAYFYRYVDNLDISNVLLVLFAGLIIYVCMLFFYMRRVGKAASKRYRIASKKLEYYDAEEKKLLELYRKEERAQDSTEMEDR